jgi:hypothetical protein
MTRWSVNPSALYLGDNGRCYCGAHLGMTASMTGRDLSGQQVMRLRPEDVRDADAMGFDPRCEQCGKAASRLVTP